MAPELPDNLLGQLQRQRWFAAKGRSPTGAALVDRALLERASPPVALELVEVTFAAGPPETYVLVRSGDPGVDALGDPRVARAFLRHLYDGTRLPSEHGGTFAFWGNDVLHGLSLARVTSPRLLGAEQSNTSIRYGDSLLLKLFRRVLPGRHPEVEVGQFLTDRTSFRDMPLLAGTLNYRAPDGAVCALGVLQSWVPNDGDGWAGTLARLEGVLAGGSQRAAVAPVERLAEVVGGLHIALASDPRSPAFAPEPITAPVAEAWEAEIRAELERAAGALERVDLAGLLPDGLPAGVAALDLPRLLERAAGVRALLGSLMIRHHGDLHLGQVLERHDPDGEVSYNVIDFEGEPAKPLTLRRERRSPLRDVAGVLRSLDYARHAALRAGDPGNAGRRERADAWHAAARGAFTRVYVRSIHQRNARLLPGDEAAVHRALDALEVEKAAYEVLYELNNRPDWLPIPLAALLG